LIASVRDVMFAIQPHSLDGSSYTCLYLVWSSRRRS
jgi:hypothetical protein